jgi:hypothetical protein
MSPGDLVVCVNTGIIPGAFNVDLHLLRKGDVYTIDNVFSVPPHGYGVTLIEVPIRANCAWVSSRFRPCQKTSIDDLTACTKERERELAE